MSRSKHKPKRLTVAQRLYQAMKKDAEERVSPAHRAVARSQWRDMERDILSMTSGTPCGSLIAGICRCVVPAHTIAESMEGAGELLAILDDAMGILAGYRQAGYLWDEAHGPLLAQAGDIAVQIMLGSPIADISSAGDALQRMVMEVAP